MATPKTYGDILPTILEHEPRALGWLFELAAQTMQTMEKQMSFSFTSAGPAFEVEDKIREDKYLPDPIKDYLVMGVAALAARYGDDVDVVASASGHLHTGEEGNYDVTSATINVCKAANI